MTYELDGAKYKKASAHQKEWGQRLIDECALSGNERILDLGCGDGVLTARLAGLVPRGFVLGLDASRSMIATAEKGEKPNLKFKIADINHLDFSAEFDLVFSNAALHWITDHQSLLSRVYRALKKNGIVRFNFAGKGNCATFFKIVREVMQQQVFVPDFADFQWPWFMPEPGEYEALVKQFPFKETRVWSENAERYFPDAEAIIGWLDQPSLVPLLHVVEAERKSEFRNMVVERMLKETRRDDGTYFEIFRRLNLFARK